MRFRENDVWYASLKIVKPNGWRRRERVRRARMFTHYSKASNVIEKKNSRN
jgi:hypothetical protein